MPPDLSQAIVRDNPFPLPKRGKVGDRRKSPWEMGVTLRSRIEIDYDGTPTLILPL
jgi:hypothetical protein